ncbi:MAG: hypothetical protein ACI84C_000747 [Flavobacteriales bacterium]|jgi:hypothetical protein
MTTIQFFREDFSSGLFTNIGGVWWKFTLVYGIQYAILIVIGIAVAASMLNYEFMAEIISDPEAFGESIEQDPEQLLNIFSNGKVDWLKLGIVGMALMIFGLVMSAWMQNVYLKLNDSQIRTGNSSLTEVLKNSFDSKLWTLLAVTLIIIVAMVGMYLVFIATIMLHWSVAFLAFIGLSLVAFRFLLAPAATIHGDLSPSESIRYSFEKITWKRSFLLILLSLVVGIVFAIAALIIFTVLGLIILIPFLGVVIYFAGSVFFYGLANAMIYSGMSGLYFRYSDDDPEAEDTSGMSLEDHLISDLPS